MICAYDKVYLNMAQRVMGNMLNYAQEYWNGVMIIRVNM